MSFLSQRLQRLGLILLLGIIGASCTDERIVYRDRELFTEPPPGAANFLGYTDQTTKLTVCGNCHIGVQSEWVGTKHADAFATLVGSGHAQAFCEGCHSVGSLGNATTGMTGWDATKDARYHDVQCESCHGPGQQHVVNPTSSNLPLANFVTGTTAEKGCGECHTGAHHPFVEEWEESRHATVYVNAIGRAECETCHVGSSVLAAWGVNTNFIEKGDPDVHPATECVVCHDPHSKRNPSQLRFAIDVPNEDTNLCMKCHNRRANPDPSSSRGPHAPHGPTLLGNAGWFPPNFSLPQGAIIATHGSERNPKLCAGCHVNRFEVTDAASGEFLFQATGHLFAAIPCLDATGKPVAGDCAVTQRSFKSCSGVGCHTAASGRGAFIASEFRIELLASTLAAMIAKIPASEFSTGDNRYTTGEGAKFNLQLAQSPGAVIHNPFLIEALVTASMKQVTLDYGITSPPEVVLDNILQKGTTN